MGRSCSRSNADVELEAFAIVAVASLEASTILNAIVRGKVATTVRLVAFMINLMRVIAVDASRMLVIIAVVKQGVFVTATQKEPFVVVPPTQATF